MATRPASSGHLEGALQDTPHTFLQPTLPLYTDAIAYLKHALDPLANEISSTQRERQRDARRKRKRGTREPEEVVLKIKQIYTDGFGVDQIWEQARRVIDAAAAEAERGIAKGEVGELPNTDSNLVDGRDLEGSDDEASLGQEGVDYEVEGIDEDSAQEDDDLGFEGVDDYDEQDLGDEDLDMDEEFVENDEPAEEFVSDKFGLNDGFFSIDDFNRKSDFLEQQDARGDDDGAASDEEDVDWDADPLGQGAAAALANGNSNGMTEDGADDDDYEEGPTFGDPDAGSEDEDDDVDGGELDAMDGLTNTNNIMYTDFFAPPAQKKRKEKKGRPNPHNFPSQDTKGADDIEDDVERTMAGVHRDLFEDESEEEEEDEAQPDLDPSDPKSRRSAYERRKAALAEEIRKLEAANVAKREWVLSGEARAADRPLNSLLEQDLEFERAGKPVPVATAELSESIEELIKRRILAQDFQDIIRRRPDDLATGSAARRGRLDFELDNNKSQKGLAEEYEEEHLRRTDPNFVDVKDEKVKKEEKEIEGMWKKISSDLDSLSSWHFRPKQPAPQLDIRVDAPAIGMEDARPNAGGEIAGASQLAPQEVYKGGEGAKGVREEVVGKSGLPSGREEMNREERKRRRRREKERGKKAGANEVPKASTKGEKEKEMLGDMKKGGVKVIGKQGQMTDVAGKEVRQTNGGPQGGGTYKL